MTSDTNNDTAALLHQCENVLAAAQDQLAKLVPDWLMYSEDPATNRDLKEYEQVMEDLENLLKLLSNVRK